MALRRSLKHQLACIRHITSIDGLLFGNTASGSLTAEREPGPAAYRTSQQRSISTSSVSFKESVTDTFNLLPPDVGLIQVHGCFDGGFIVGDVQVGGSILCIGDLWLRWKVDRFSDITIESLSLLDLALPIPELLIVGCGDRIRQVPDNLMQELRKRYVSVEAMDTKNAVATFNILNQEDRKVLGAFIPIDATE
ncbi:hypothetical protein M9434_004400 [Picochlorum sp. BPE23]|nr:hypothetical protein M9434_004400 [Picochlorum sp. BPE23]